MGFFDNSLKKGHYYMVVEMVIITW